MEKLHNGTGPEITTVEKLSDEEQAGIYITGGFGHPHLTADIAREMGIDADTITEKMHPNGELYTRFDESVRKKHVFIVQSHVESSLNGKRTSINDAIFEQHLLTDAAFSSSASEITVVNPHMGYLRQDRKAKGREPIGTRVLLQQTKAAGARRVVAVDMHNSSAQAGWVGPFDELTAQPLLNDMMAEEVARFPRDEWLVIAPDAGAGKLTEMHSKMLGSKMLYLSKMRDPNDSQKIRREEHVPEADGRVCIIFDDMIDTGGTLTSAAELLHKSGAKAILLAATHGIFSEPAIDRLKEAPINRILITDTVPVDVAKHELGDKLRVVPVAPVIARDLLNIYRGNSVSEPYGGRNYR